MVRLVVPRPVAREVDGRELVEGELAVGRRVAAGAVRPQERVGGVGLGRTVAGRQSTTGGRCSAGERAAHEEAVPEGLAHVADAAQVLPDEAGLELLVVGGERAGRPGRPPARDRCERRLRGESPRLDRVVDALERRHVDEAGAVAAQEQAGCVEALRERDVAALRDRLRPPADALAALEDPPDARMELQLLQQVVHRQLDVAVVEADHHAERDHVVAHGIDERAAELAVLPPAAQRPTERVDDAPQRPCDLPDLLHAERPHLRVLAGEVEVLERGAREVALRALAEDRHARLQVRARLEVGQRVAVPAAPLVAGPHADDAPAGDEQLLRVGLREDGRPERLGVLGEPATQLGQRRDVVAVVGHARRRRDAHGRAAGQEEHRLLVHRPVEGHVRDVHPVSEQAPEAAWVDHGAGKQVRPRRLALLQHGHGHVPEPLGHTRVLLQQLPEADRAREAGRAGPHDQHADVDALVGRVGRLGDRLRRRERRRVVGRPDRPAAAGHGLATHPSAAARAA